MAAVLTRRSQSSNGKEVIGHAETARRLQHSFPEQVDTLDGRPEAMNTPDNTLNTCSDQSRDDRSATTSVAVAPMTLNRAPQEIGSKNLLTPYDVERTSPELVINEGNYFPAGHRLIHSPSRRAFSPVTRTSRPTLLLTSGIRLGRRDLSVSRLKRQLVDHASPKTSPATLQLRKPEQAIYCDDTVTPQNRYQRLARIPRASRP